MVIAVFLAFLAAIAPLLSNAFNIAFFQADVLSAKSFASELEQKADSLRFLGNGSSVLVEAIPYSNWEVFAENSTMFIKIQSPALEAEKTFSVAFPNKLFFPKTVVSEKSDFVLFKENDEVSVEYS